MNGFDSSSTDEKSDPMSPPANQPRTMDISEADERIKRYYGNYYIFSCVCKYSKDFGLKNESVQRIFKILPLSTLWWLSNMSEGPFS